MQNKVNMKNCKKNVREVAAANPNIWSLKNEIKRKHSPTCRVVVTRAVKRTGLGFIIELKNYLVASY